MRLLSKHSLPFPDVRGRSIPAWAFDSGRGHVSCMEHEWRQCASLKLTTGSLRAPDYLEKNMFQRLNHEASIPGANVRHVSRATPLPASVQYKKVSSSATELGGHSDAVTYYWLIQWVISLLRCLRMIFFFSNCHSLELGTMAETHKPFF